MDARPRGRSPDLVEALPAPGPGPASPDLVRRLADAWHEHDGDALEHSRDDHDPLSGSVYQDPFGSPAIGVGAFSTATGYGVAPGGTSRAPTWERSDVQQDSIRMAWRHCPSGLSLLEGVDLATLGPDGRIASIVSFWSRYVEEPAEGACDGPRMNASPSSTSAPGHVRAW